MPFTKTCACCGQAFTDTSHAIICLTCWVTDCGRL